MFKKLFVYWAPVLCYMAFIFYISSIRATVPIIAGFSVNTKILHAIEFFVLGILLLRAFNSTWMYRYAFHIAILVTAIYGFLDEIHQAFVPGRYADFYDAIADSTGAVSILVLKVPFNGKLFKLKEKTV